MSSGSMRRVCAPPKSSPTIEDIDWSTYQYVYTWGDLLTFDNIRIVDLYEHDVQVALNAPASVVAGNTAKLQVKLSNNAQNSANGFTLKLSANDKVFFDKTFDAVIPAFSTLKLSCQSFQWLMPMKSRKKRLKVS